MASILDKKKFEKLRDLEFKASHPKDHLDIVSDKTFAQAIDRFNGGSIAKFYQFEDGNFYIASRQQTPKLIEAIEKFTSELKHNCKCKFLGNGHKCFSCSILYKVWGQYD